MQVRLSIYDLLRDTSRESVKTEKITENETVRELLL